MKFLFFMDITQCVYVYGYNFDYFLPFSNTVTRLRILQVVSLTQDYTLHTTIFHNFSMGHVTVRKTINLS